MEELGCTWAWYAVLPLLLPAPGLSLSPELPARSFGVRAAIVSRYASTCVCSAVHNPHAVARHAAFELDLPPAAFITNFTVIVGGKAHQAEVMEKRRARELYEAARQQGRTAAHVGTKEKETQRFHVTASVAAGGDASFELCYEELLRRRLGTYRYTVHLHPQRVVPELRVELSITERAGIAELRVLPLPGGRLTPSVRVEKGTHCAHVAFTPTPQDRAALGGFVLEYDVARPDAAGDVELYDGYFVHFFAPTGLSPIPKDIVFVIDVSGSMSGTKMKQTKAAMRSILRDLRPRDRFNIVAFSEAACVWQEGGSIPASASSIRSATRYIDALQADGWTDINHALQVAAALLQHPAEEPRVALLLLLTDGEPTAGVTDGPRIVSNARRALSHSAALLFGLAFGADADFALLRRLAAASGGTARHIPEDADAAFRLTDVFQEIDSPLLQDVELTYPGTAAQLIAPKLFPGYFQGSELVVAGRLEPGTELLRIRASGRGDEGELHAHTEVVANVTELPPGCPRLPAELLGAFVCRLWAFVTIQELLRAQLGANSTAARRRLAAEATELSLRYHFVTPFTSLVVVTADDGGLSSPPSIATNGPTATPDVTGTPDGAVTAAVTVLGELGDHAVTGNAVPPTVQQRPPPQLQVPPVPWGGPSLPRGPGNAVLLQTDEAELLAPGVGSEEFVESLNPPVYVILTPTGLPDDEDATDLTRDVDVASSSPTFFTFSASVDGDPHFVARVQGTPYPLCFTLDGRPGDTLQLLTDPSLGLRVHGHLLSAPSWPSAPSRPRTFVSAVTILGHTVVITVTLHGVRVSGEGPPISLPFSRPTQLHLPPVTLLLGPGGRLHLQWGPRLELVVLRHRYSRPGALQRDHLGFYITNGSRLSPGAGGLLGRLRGIQLSPLGTPGTARLSRGEVTVMATLVTKELQVAQGTAQPGRCWLIPRSEVSVLLGGPYGDFLSPSSLLA
ncbi:inter-alpha-trypsin inhibitor heavy chain H6 isoform X3 [Gallus gallus]|uniref:Inter-alpha-trypsin inhibitor heavy chain family member 6 n=1 Tax=Gallus gallus TaxID=9031 RepID=A0A8V0X7M2_CHICK|nr:inter-alpha-trypsin inhibitor heavy chain H6 isoform X3 [Gallus gallus]